MKYINKIITYPAIALAVMLQGACKKQLDINENPNFPTYEQGTPGVVLPAAELATIGKTGFELAIFGGIWSQYFTESAFASQYRTVDAYNVTNTDILLNSAYRDLFSRGLKNYQYVIDKARASGDWNMFLVGTLMKVYTTQVLVDMFDQIPYSEALLGVGNLKPKFDDGYAIYSTFVPAIDSALAQDFSLTTNSIIGKQDLVFGGDIDKWKLFANTLKLKIYLRMVNAHADVAQAGIQKLKDDGAQFLDDNAEVSNFSDEPFQENPLYEDDQRANNTTDNLKASYTFVSWLEENNDPRIVYYFGTPSPTPQQQGDYAGSDPSYAGATTFAQYPTSPVELISKAESYFLQAEADLRYSAGANTQALYEAGVTAAFEATGNSDVVAEYIALGGAYEWGNELEDSVTADGDRIPVPLSPLAQIIRQKWAHFCYGLHQIEGFFDKNRTGFPATSPVYSTEDDYVSGQFVIGKNSILPDGKLPRRFVFPYDETSRNPNAPQIVVPTETPVWWALQ